MKVNTMDKLVGKRVELEARINSAKTELAKAALSQEMRILMAKIDSQAVIDNAREELEKLNLPTLQESLARAQENLKLAEGRIAKLRKRINAISEA